MLTCNSAFSRRIDHHVGDAAAVSLREGQNVPQRTHELQEIDHTTFIYTKSEKKEGQGEEERENKN